jgi:hypothetical protein
MLLLAFTDFPGTRVLNFGVNSTMGITAYGNGNCFPHDDANKKGDAYRCYINAI